MTYGTTITEHDLGKWGTMKFVQWNHPQEHRKEFTERDIDWLAQFIKPGDTAIDIGAYIGDTAMPMAVAAGPNGKIYAFEPNRASLSVLLLQSLPIAVFPYAVGVRREERIFRYHLDAINGGYLTEGEPVTVQCVRLDECEINEPLAFVKIDTEGEDGAILATYTDWLIDHGKPVVQVERYPYLDVKQSYLLWKAIAHYGVPSLKDDWTFTELKELPSTLVDIIIKPHE